MMPIRDNFLSIADGSDVFVVNDVWSPFSPWEMGNLYQTFTSGQLLVHVHSEIHCTGMGYKLGSLQVRDFDSQIVFLMNLP